MSTVWNLKIQFCVCNVPNKLELPLPDITEIRIFVSWKWTRGHPRGLNRSCFDGGMKHTEDWLHWPSGHCFYLFFFSLSFSLFLFLSLPLSRSFMKANADSVKKVSNNFASFFSFKDQQSIGLRYLLSYFHPSTMTQSFKEIISVNLRYAEIWPFILAFKSHVTIFSQSES